MANLTIVLVPKCVVHLKIENRFLHVQKRFGDELLFSFEHRGAMEENDCKKLRDLRQRVAEKFEKYFNFLEKF